MELTTTFGDDLHLVMREAAAAGPITLDAQTGAVCVLHYDDIERLAHERRLAGVGMTMFDLVGVGEGPLRRWYGGLMFTNEGDAHRRLRSLVGRAFTPRAVESRRADVARLAAASLAPLRADGGGDVLAALGLLPTRAMCGLLGVPPADVEVFGSWADALSPVFGFMTPEQITDASRAIEDLLAYIDDLVARRRAEPGDDIITALLAAEEDGGRLTHDEVLTMVANLLVGGHDTTASQLGCTLITLVRHPEQTERLRRDAELVSAAVNETIRYEPSLPVVPRTVVESFEVGGHPFLVGAIVLLATGAANRQPDVWQDPDVFDVERFTRPSAPRLLTFGAGPHFCLGAALARLTIEEAVRAVLDLGAFEVTGDPWTVPWRMVLGRSPVHIRISIT